MGGEGRRKFLQYKSRFDVFERFGQVGAPVIVKSQRANLRLSSRRALECSLIATLLMIILAFRYWPVYERPSATQLITQEIVQLEDIEQTRQEKVRPPPPRPVIPIEVPSDELLDDVTIASTEIDLAEELAPPAPDSLSDEERYFVVVEELPQIIGGMEELQKYLVYPQLALRAGLEGTVFVQAYVDERGRVQKTEVIRGLGVGLDEAAQRAVEKLKFIPGRQRGKPRKVLVSIPVKFRIISGKRRTG